nr:hypothetical protein [Bacteroidota bacterium]
MIVIMNESPIRIEFVAISVMIIIKNTILNSIYTLRNFTAYTMLRNEASLPVIGGELCKIRILLLKRIITYLAFAFAAIAFASYCLRSRDASFLSISK